MATFKAAKDVVVGDWIQFAGLDSEIAEPCISWERVDYVHTGMSHTWIQCTPSEEEDTGAWNNMHYPNNIAVPVLTEAEAAGTGGHGLTLN